jgi:hypothetical protein
LPECAARVKAGGDCKLANDHWPFQIEERGQMELLSAADIFMFQWPIANLQFLGPQPTVDRLQIAAGKC